MFDLVRISDYAVVPVPLPGRAILFCDAEGHLRAKLHDGSVLPGAGGSGDLVDSQLGFEVGALRVLYAVGSVTVSGVSKSFEQILPGTVVLTGAASLSWLSNGSLMPVDAGQSWRFMGGFLAASALIPKVAHGNCGLWLRVS